MRTFDNSLTQRHNDFCEAVARGADPAEVFKRLYSTKSRGWRANLARLLKNGKTQGRIAAIRERLGIAVEPVDTTTLDDETARLLQENADAIEAAKASGNLNALVKLMAQAERLSKRAKPKQLEAKPEVDRIATMRAVLGHKAPNLEVSKRVDELSRGHASMLDFFESNLPLSPQDHARLQAEEDWIREHCPKMAALTGLRDR